VAKLRSNWIFIALAGLVLAAVGYRWGLTSSPSTAGRAGKTTVQHAQERPTADDNRQLAALQQEVRALRAANAALVLQRQAAAEAPPELSGAQAREEPTEPEADQLELEEQARQTRIQYFDELSRRIDTEAIDGAWRHDTEGPLKQLLAKHLGPEISVAEATCASSYCRVKLNHPQSPRLRGSTFSFDLARASLEVTEVSFDNREQGTTTLYFKRGPAPATQLAEAAAKEPR
jgi:hypothetical protein